MLSNIYRLLFLGGLWFFGGGIVVLQCCVSFYSTEKWSRVPCAIQPFTFVIYFMHISVYMSIPISQFIPLPLLGVLIFVLYICISVCALQTGSSVPFFQIPHICINKWYLFFSFWLISPVRQYLSPSTSLQMTQFHCFIWLSNIPLYICTTSSISIHLSMDI